MAKEKITPNQTFMDGRERFEANQTYSVEAERAAFYRANGWTGDPASGLTPEQEITLDIQNVEHQTTGKIKE